MDGKKGRYLGQGAFGTVRVVEGQAEKRSELFRMCGGGRWHLVPEVLNEAVFALWCTRQKIPGLVTYHSVRLDRDDHNVVIRQQLAQLGDLDSFITSNSPEARIAAAPHVLAQLLRGMAGMHLVGLMFGDLKPSNVLVMALQPAIHVCLADLGGSFLYKRAPLEQHRFGTITFLPPESFSDTKPATPALLLKADAWALGVLMHNLVFGCTMCADFDADMSLDAIGDLHHAGKVKPHSTTCPPGLSPEVFDAMLELLRPDPSERVTIMELYWRTAVDIEIMSRDTVVIDPLGGDASSTERMSRMSRIDTLHRMCNDRRHCFALAVNLADRFADVSPPVLGNTQLRACVAIADSVLQTSVTEMDTSTRDAVMDVVEAVQWRVYGDACDELLMQQFSKISYTDVRSALEKFPATAAAVQHYTEMNLVDLSDT